MPDEKNSKIYRSYISAPQLTVYDYTIYIEDTKEDQETQKYKKIFKQRYLKFIEDMFDACLGKNHGLKATDVWDVEYDILGALGCDGIKKDSENGYNVVHKSESLEKCGLDWNELAKQIGYKTVPDKYICTSLNYVSCIMGLLIENDTWKSDKWRTYYYYIVFRQLMRFHSKWRLIYYDFHEKFIKGQPVPWPKEIYPILVFLFVSTIFYLKNILNAIKSSNRLIMLKIWQKICLLFISVLLNAIHGYLLKQRNMHCKS